MKIKDLIKVVFGALITIMAAAIAGLTAYILTEGLILNSDPELAGYLAGFIVFWIVLYRYGEPIYDWIERCFRD